MKKESLERSGFGLAIMFFVYWMYIIYIQSRLNIPQIYIKIIGLVILYGIGLFLFLQITKKIPNAEIKRNKISIKVIFSALLLQFSAFIALVVGNVVINIIDVKGNEGITELSLYTVVLLLVFNPIVEEIVFRKILAKKLLKYGELFYIVSSSICFATVHLVSMGIPIVGYTFILGLIWAYLYVKTGNILIPIIMHSISNLFGVIINVFLSNISLKIAGIYFMTMVALGVIGLINFKNNKNKIVIDDRNILIDKKTLIEIFNNKGILFQVILMVIIFILI